MGEETKTSKLNELLQQLKGEKEGVDSAPLAPENAPALVEDDELIDMGEDFDFDNYQVVRREFFAHSREPSATFNDFKFSVNTACLSKFPKCDYAQVLVNQKSKILAIRPCEENEKDSYAWCCVKNGRRSAKQITCKLFFAKIVELMHWEPKYRYKMLGKLVYGNGEYLIAFDLTATEVYRKIYRDGEKPKASRTPIFPADWQNQFGVPFKEHRASMAINIFDGYAIYTIKENELIKEDSNQPQNEVTSNE